MTAEEAPVQPDLAVAEDAVKLQVEDLARVGLGNDQVLAIQCHLSRQVAMASIVGGTVRAPSTIQHIVVWQLNGLPLPAIVACRDDRVTGDHVARSEEHTSELQSPM